MVATCPGLGCSNRLSRPSSPAARKGRHFAPSKSFRMKLPSLKLPFGSRKPPCAAAAGAPPAELEDAQGAVPPAPPLIQSGAAKTHLVVLVNGLFGSPANWTVIAGLLNQHLDQDSVLIHISAANQYRQVATTTSCRSPERHSIMFETCFYRLYHSRKNHYPYTERQRNAPQSAMFNIRASLITLFLNQPFAGRHSRGSMYAAAA